MDVLLRNKNAVNPHISVDCVIFGFDFPALNVLLIERAKVDDTTSPTANLEEEQVMALPGDHIMENENLDQSAIRVLKELTNLDNIYLEQFHAFGNPNRASEEDRAWMRTIRSDPNARVITVAYYSLVKQALFQPSAASFARGIKWYPVTDVPKLAFDHNYIVEKALDALRYKLKNEPIGFELLPEKFSLSHLRKLYEVILGTELEKRNFRRKILKQDFLIPLNEKQTGVPHKAARLYKFDRERYERLKKSTHQKDISFIF